MLPNAILLAADPSLSDDTVITRVLQGNKEDYEILVRRYNNQLYKTARGILSKEADVEDVMQEAYLKGYEKLGQFRREAKFSTWLTRIVINCALQQIHKLKGKEHLDVDALKRSDVESLSEEPPDPRSSPEVAENIRKALEAAISGLPSKYRIVFMLREIQHTSVADTASALDISEDNVKIRLHRAKNMLRDRLHSELKSLEVFEFHESRCTLIANAVMSRIMGPLAIDQ